ncbi:MAG: 3-oxoacyl-[acyl-carrier-protein] synthase [Proteobacteria bacterium]|nr:3-oxoacyl-[acyl-carrier-protein] synthase [Pseudomonadota bacterium]
MAKAKIIGTGLYAPGTPIPNEELWKLIGVEFDQEKLESKIGIYARHMAKLRGLDETTTDFATKAAEQAIANAGIDPMEVRLFIVGTDTPGYISPGSAVMVQGRIQGKELPTACMDINCSCAGFTTALDVAAKMVATDDTYKYAVVVGVYNMPAFIKPGDAFGHAIFADGAGAVVLERTEDSDISGYIGGHLKSDGTQWDFIGVYSGGTKRPITHEILDSGEYGLQNLKPLPGNRNVQLWPPIANDLMKKFGMEIKDIDHIIFTQINKSVIEQVMAILGLPMEKTTMIMDKYGYTGSGCVPMAFHQAVIDGKVKKGDKVVFIASGAGFFVGSNVFTY